MCVDFSVGAQSELFRNVWTFYISVSTPISFGHRTPTFGPFRTQLTTRVNTTNERRELLNMGGASENIEEACPPALPVRGPCPRALPVRGPCQPAPPRPYRRLRLFNANWLMLYKRYVF